MTALGPLGATGLAWLCACALAGPAAARPADALTLRSGREKTFTLSGPRTHLAPGRVREASAGLTRTGPGEITVGMWTTYAVGRLKLHVYERSPRAVMFRATFSGLGSRPSMQELCGRLETDSWIVAPPRTTRVIVYHFVEVADPCPS